MAIIKPLSVCCNPGLLRPPLTRSKGRPLCNNESILVQNKLRAKSLINLFTQALFMFNLDLNFKAKKILCNIYDEIL